LKSGYATRQSYDQAQQQVRTEEAAVESAQAATSTAEEQLGYAELKAGVAGIITARSAETGQVVQASLRFDVSSTGEGNAMRGTLRNFGLKVGVVGADPARDDPSRVGVVRRPKRNLIQVVATIRNFISTRPSVMGRMRSSPPNDRHVAELTLLSVGAGID